MKKLYTIGHSNQSQEDFLSMLCKHDIDCVVDVRSVPASKYSPQFNQEELKWFLKRNGVQYLHFGEEFGARRLDCLNEEGQVDFEKAVTTPSFLSGVDRLRNGLEKGFHISLMCSEANPLECHRFSLVSRYFFDQGIDVRHILKGAELAPHAVVERKMIEEYLHSKKYHLSEVDQLFGIYTAEMQRQDAYRLKNKEIGYKPQLQTEEDLAAY
ncbi:MAG: DUF488 domain-containing protein [Prevotella sp.]|nr:DUF488 domain-containing protein [Prevotella sp.]